jgi:hypothetical protein
MSYPGIGSHERYIKMTWIAVEIQSENVNDASGNESRKRYIKMTWIAVEIQSHKMNNQIANVSLRN